MATRKSRQNTESPTPFATEAAPTTPTTPATRNTRSIRNKQLQRSKGDEATVTVKSEKIDEDDEAVKDTLNDEDADAGKDKDAEPIDKEADATPPPAASTRKRRIVTHAKDDASTPTAEAAASPIDDGKTSPNKMKRSRRSAFELLTGSKPDDSPSAVSKRRNSTGKLDRTRNSTRKLSSRIKKLKQLRKTTLKRSLLKKSDRLAATVTKPPKQVAADKVTAVVKAVDKSEKNDSASDTEVMKMSRRRSDSVSKCSDMTDASSFQESKDAVEESSTASVIDPSDSVEIKQEAIDKEEAAQAQKADATEQSDAVLSPSTAANDSGTGGESDARNDIDDSKRPRSLRRGKRPNLPIKVMNTRSRSQTPCKTTEDDDDRSGTPKELKTDVVDDAPLHIDTAAGEAAAADDEAKTDVADDDTTKSLSPALVSEGVSEISVKQFYGRADFLENNLGIENDPKLGEIVQEQEKLKETLATADKEATASATTAATDLTEDCEQTEPLAERDEPAAAAAAAAEPMEQEPIAQEPATLQMDTSVETVDVDVEKSDGAKCDVAELLVASREVDCFVKPSEVVRKKSATMLSENLPLLNGVEIEFTKKEHKKEVKRSDEDDVGGVVLYAISSNGELVNPEKLEKVQENLKLKERERSDSCESADNKLTIVEANGSRRESTGEPAKMGDDSAEPMQSEAVLKALQSIDKDEEEVVDDANDEPTETETAVGGGSGSGSGPASIANSIGSRSSSIDDESPEERVQKESHLKTLGLLTHQAAVEATIEKQKQREKIKASISSGHGGKGKKYSEYTGTLKTIIKLHRGNNNEKKKANQPLKMTLHKGRGKNGSDKNDASAQDDEDTYYTIQQQDAEGMDINDLMAEEAAMKEHEKLLVIPEKASSFRYHPEKICEDQCFYCGGKFGLFDTPCHIAQIKSAERQKKILEYEEKLTVDSCLCDACFRHVDRRANCPSYKKRLSEPSKSTETEEPKEADGILFQNNRELTWCQVVGCKDQASQSLCSKWAQKMRRTLTKYVRMNFENTSSMAFLPICDKHYDDINQLLVCIVCNRRLKRNNCYFMNQDVNKIEALVANDGIPISIGTTAIGCKLCRYYVNLLMKPQEAKKGDFIKEHRRRLAELHKLEMVDEDSDQSQIDQDQPTVKRAKRNRKPVHDLSATNSDDGSIKSTTKSSDNMDLNSSATRTRQKAKQSSQQQLLIEQQRAEQEQLRLKQQELLQQQQSHREELRQRVSHEDITNLRTNPNISMRELFPGEEDLGLHVSLPFANSWRTPDGWMKVTSTVQYDEPTRRLWEDLQKPYGNQSSFLRHLLLLEKYFRNGDLLLAQNANVNAAVYAESVQHRLQAYDNIPPRPVSITQLTPQTTITPATSSAIDLSSAKGAGSSNRALSISKTPSKTTTTPALTITPTPKTVDNANSLLKSNASQVLRGRGYTITTEPNTSEKSAANAGHSEQLKKALSANGGGAATTSTPKNKAAGMPPELICITSPNAGDKQSSSLPPPSYQLQMQLTLQQQIQQQHQNSLLLTQQHKQMLQSLPAAAALPALSNSVTPPKKQSTSSGTHKSPNQSNANHSKANVIRLPDALTDDERRESKAWRPTLMPITADKSGSSPEIYQTADGRRLPYLVQVQSGGKPYMISIHDYNRMCILRRESLLRTDQPKGKSTSPKSATATMTGPTSSGHSKAITAIDVDKLMRPHINANAAGSMQISNKVQIPNKILEQNSLIPLNSKQSDGQQGGGSDSLLKRNKNPSLLKSNAVSTGQHVAKLPQPMASLASTIVQPKLPLALSNALSQQNVVSITSTPSLSAMFAMNAGVPVSTPPPSIQLIPNALSSQPITITNVTTQSSAGSAALASNQAKVAALEALFKTTNQVTTTPTTMWQWAEQLNKSNSSLTALNAMDSSASSILSKIPKSLTVIPQKRLSKGADE